MLEDKVSATISRFHMLSPGDLVLVAVSGGPDSVSLLHVLNTLKTELGIILHAAHLNHMFRGAEAEGDARFVKDFSESLGIPATIRTIDVPAYMRATGKSAQEAAREIRYSFLEEAAEETGAARIAVGHTADDQVETVLINLLRGAGIDGLRGIPPVRGKIIRPLFECWRHEIVKYCHRQGLKPREDSSNLKPIYLRNRIRHELVPLIEREFSPDIRHLLQRMSELMREDSEYLLSETRAKYDQLLKNQVENRVELYRDKLSELHPAIARRILRESVRFIKGDLSQIGYEVIEEVLSATSNAGSFKINLPGNLFVEGTPVVIRFYRPDKTVPVPEVQCTVTVPGLTYSSDLHTAIDARILSGKQETNLDQGPWLALIDWDCIEPPLVLRNRRPGDRVKLLGMRGTQKLQDIFINKKIPSPERSRTPIVADKAGIVWIPGLTVADRVKVTETTSRLLKMSAIHEGNLPETT